MARAYTKDTLNILTDIAQRPGVGTRELFKSYSKLFSYKDFYNVIFRLCDQGMVKKEKAQGQLCLEITADGKNLLGRKVPTRDGVWKLVIFDIPEKHQKVRTVLRAKLRSLGFQKWQNSIWASPYQLDSEIREELDMLASRFFIRLVEVSSINRYDDLEAMFLPTETEQK